MRELLSSQPCQDFNPKTLDDAINHIVGKVLDILRIDNDLYQRWNKGVN